MHISIILTLFRYKNNIEKKSSIIQDQPIKPLDNAVFWLEHVIKHKGGQHLRSTSADVTYVQFLLLDVIAFICFIIGSLILLFILVCKVITMKCKKSEKNKSD